MTQKLLANIAERPLLHIRVQTTRHLLHGLLAPPQRNHALQRENKVIPKIIVIVLDNILRLFTAACILTDRADALQKMQAAQRAQVAVQRIRRHLERRRNLIHARHALRHRQHNRIIQRQLAQLLLKQKQRRVIEKAARTQIQLLQILQQRQPAVHQRQILRRTAQAGVQHQLLLIAEAVQQLRGLIIRQRPQRHDSTQKPCQRTFRAHQTALHKAKLTAADKHHDALCALRLRQRAQRRTHCGMRQMIEFIQHKHKALLLVVLREQRKGLLPACRCCRLRQQCGKLLRKAAHVEHIASLQRRKMQAIFVTQELLQQRRLAHAAASIDGGQRKARLAIQLLQRA